MIALFCLKNLHFTFKVDTTSTASAFWDAGLTQSDITQLSVMAESKMSDSTHVWHHKLIDNSRSSCNAISRIQMDTSWLSSPHSSGPSHLFQDATDDSKSVSAWPISKTDAERLNNEHLLDQVDKENKVETTTSYRLFGIELIDHARSSPVVEKACAHAANASGVTNEGCVSTLSQTDADLGSDISKASKERKQDQLQVSTKETQSKQICSRSCTKVLDIYCLFR